MPNWQPGSSRTQGPLARAEAAAARTTPGRHTEDMEGLIFSLHQTLIEELDADQISSMASEERRRLVEQAAETVLRREVPSMGGITRDQIVTRVVDEVVGLGPIDGMIRDPSVSEVMVNAPDEVYFEREGIIYLSDIRFRDADHVQRTIERTVDGLVGADTIEPEVAQFLKACVKLRLNILISGGTGTGKTTFLNALSAYSREGVCSVRIEDPTELRLQQPHVVSLEARPPNIDGKGEIQQRDLLRNTLRMRPDRIIIGEVRGPEAFDMLNAMNTGHEGSLSTVHANAPRDALARVENMVMMANLDLPDRAIREQVASALHLIVQLARFSDGVRRVTHITEITGMEGQIVTIQDLFKFTQTGVDAEGRILGYMTATGLRPTFADRFALAGIQLPEAVFMPARGG